MTIELALRATALLGLASALAWSKVGLPAAARHALWRLTVIVTLMLPALGAVSPGWSLLPAVPGVSRAAERDTAPSNENANAHGPAVLTLAATKRAGDLASLWWWGGLATVTLYFASGYARLWALRRRARPAPPEWGATVARLAPRARISYAPRVLVSSRVSGPLVSGVVRPVVLIPPAACAWSAARRDAVLVHELSHISRGDMVAQLGAHVLVAVHWFNPLAWHALRQMRRERELACDEAVLRAGISPLVYATELLAIAAEGVQCPVPASGLSMAHRPELESRMSAILEGGAGCVWPANGWLVSLAVVLASVMLAGVTLTPQRSSGGAAAAPVTRWNALLPGEDRATKASSIDGLPTATTSAARERAVLALAFSSGEQVVPSLLEALTHADVGVREKAAVGLTWRRDPRIVSALITAAADPAPEVREKVLVALAFSGDSRARTIIEAARSDPDAGVRDKAVKLAAFR